jgi:flavodoxin
MNMVKKALLVLAFLVIVPCFAYGSDTLIVYYTRSGNNEGIAEYIQANIPNSQIAALTTEDDRSGFFGFITCMLDQWLDRNASINDLSLQTSDKSVIIICAPIWLQNLSSPARTFIKQVDLKDKAVYLFISYGGRLKEEKQQAIGQWVKDQGVMLKGIYGSAVGGKTADEIKQQTRDHMQKAGLLVENKSDG